jgi:hypothetical protein
MPKVNTTKVSGAKAKSTTKAKPKADAVAKKATATKPKAKSTTAKAAGAVVQKKEPKTVTIQLPPGARRIDNPELPDILKGVEGFTVKASYVFDVPVSLEPSRTNPANVGADNGPKGSNGWVLGNAHQKAADGSWLVGDDQVAKLKTAVRPLMERVLRAHGMTADSDAKISLPEGFRDSLGSLEGERKKAGLPLHSDQNYYPVQISMSDGRTWETAVHPADLNGGSSSARSMSPEDAMRLGNQLQNISNANNVPRNISRADVKQAAATLSRGADEVAAAVVGTRSSQTYWGGELVSANDVRDLANALELLALKMKQAGI